MATYLNGSVRLALNQFVETEVDALTGEPLVLAKALSASIECAVFEGEPAAETMVNTISGLVSFELVVRRINSRGPVVLTKSVDANEVLLATSYADWANNAGAQVVFNFSDEEMNQPVPADAGLKIYLAVYVITATERYLAGSASGEIQDFGITGVTNPPAPTPGFGFADLASHPTTLEGYGIANGKPKNTIYASAVAKLDSDVILGGGTVQTIPLNNALASLGLAGGGLFVLDGAALIDAPLRIPSNVTVWALHPDCGAFLKANSHCHIVTNSNFDTDTNPAEPDLADRQENITIIGGTWNQNHLNQSADVADDPDNAWCVGMWFSGVDNLRVCGVRVYDARKFALMISFPGQWDVIDYTAEWPEVRNDNNDALHLWGPCTGRGYVRNLTAINGSDDTLALNFGESAAPGNGGTVFADRPAAISTLIDGVDIQNGSSILRVDGIEANCGDIVVRNLNCRFYDSGGSVHTLFANGAWKRLLMENWTVLLPPGIPATVPKGVEITEPRDDSITELRHWRYIGDSSISLISGQNNALVSVSPVGSGTGAAKIILDDVIAEKPTASLSGALVLVYNSVASTSKVAHLKIHNCEVDGYAYLFANDSAAGIVGELQTFNNRLNGAADSFGALPPTLTGGDQLSRGLVEVYNNANISIVTSNVAQALPFNSEIRDSAGLHSTSVNTSRITALVSGIYVFEVSAMFAANATGLRELRFVYNGADILKREYRQALASDHTPVNLQGRYKLNAGDYIQVFAVQTSGGPLDVLYYVIGSGIMSPKLTVQKVD